MKWSGADQHRRGIYNLVLAIMCMIVSLISYSEQDEIEKNIDTVILLTQMLLPVALRCSGREWF
jgi:hypothetical protein